MMAALANNTMLHNTRRCLRPKEPFFFLDGGATGDSIETDIASILT